MKFKKLNSIPQFLICAWTITMLSASLSVSAADMSLSQMQKEITELKEIIFNPKSSQLAVLVSVNSKSDFRLDSLSFYINSKRTKNYFYTKRESDALKNNSMQKIYVGDIRDGEHTIKAEISATGTNKQKFNLSSSSKFTKTNTTKYIEFEISKSEQQDLPVLNIKIWE